MNTPQSAYGRATSTSFKATLKSLEGRLRLTTRPLRDRLENARYTRGDARFLILRHPAALPSYYSKFLQWTAQRFPEIRSRFELQLITRQVKNWTPYCLVVPWLPDTFLYRSQQAQQHAAKLVAEAGQRGIPVINPPEHLVHTSKHDCAQQLLAAGINAPHSVRITDAKQFREHTAGLQTPFLVREDLAHGGWSPVFKIEQLADLQAVPLEQMERPIAVEFIDTRSPTDGLVRKYRYMAMGDIGVAHTLQISQHWEVRSGVRKLTASTIQEEREYCDQADPNHSLFQSARRVLGLDFLAFDYSYDAQGKVVVWEINVLPGLGIPGGPNREHLVEPTERAMAATLKLYLLRAGLPVPASLNACVALPASPSWSTRREAA